MFPGLESFVLTPNQTNLEVVGELRAVAAAYQSIARTKNGYGVNLISQNGQITTVTFSKAISTELAKGNIKFEQLGYCNVIKGENSAKESRLYLTLPVDYRGFESTQAFIAKVNAAQRPKLAFDAAAAAAAI
jgi:hypothetical protein